MFIRQLSSKTVFPSLFNFAVGSIHVFNFFSEVILQFAHNADLFILCVKQKLTHLNHSEKPFFIFIKFWQWLSSMFLIFVILSSILNFVKVSFALICLRVWSKFCFFQVLDHYFGSVHKMANLHRNIFDTSKYFKTSSRDCSSCFSKTQINEILEH